jgi:hypothetical protein
MQFWHNCLIFLEYIHIITMNKDEYNRHTENSEFDFGRQIIETGRLLISSDLGDNRMSLYRKGNNHYLIHFQENRIVKVEKISRNLAHMQFPGLIVH